MEIIAEVGQNETCTEIYDVHEETETFFEEEMELSTELIESMETQESSFESEFWDQNDEVMSETESNCMETVQAPIGEFTYNTEDVFISIKENYQLQEELCSLSEEELERANQILNLRDGDLIILNQVSALSADAPALFSECPIAYAIDTKDGSESNIMVYHFNGVNHTYILDNNQNATDKLQEEFKSFIETLYARGDLSITSDATHSFTVTKEKKYSDVYIEAGEAPHKAEWKIRTIFQVAQNLTTSGSDGDIYGIRGIHTVYPYGWTMYATTQYSHGINRVSGADVIYSATPADKDIELNESVAYSISISYPISFSFDFSWWKEKGTRMFARRRDHQHDVIFTNPNGIVGKGENGDFTYETYTELKVPKGSDFGFYYNEVFWNSIRGSQSDMHKYGDEWLLLTPNFNSGEDVGGSTTEVYIWDGRDYSLVFNGEYYLNNYSDLRAAFGSDKKAAFTHFIQNGMAEGRQGNSNFNVYAYKGRYSDLALAFGDNLVLYYQHFIDYGYKEGRIGI